MLALRPTLQNSIDTFLAHSLHVFHEFRENLRRTLRIILLADKPEWKARGGDKKENPDAVSNDSDDNDYNQLLHHLQRKAASLVAPHLPNNCCLPYIPCTSHSQWVVR